MEYLLRTDLNWRESPLSGSNYLVSNNGLVFSKKKLRLLAKRNNNKGYEMVGLFIEGKVKFMLVHRLVASAFTEGMSEVNNQVNHIDGDKANNHYSNLEWVNNSKNQIHARLTGLNKNIGENCLLSKIKESDVFVIKDMISKGASQSFVAKKFGIHQSNVSLIVNNKTWKKI